MVHVGQFSIDLAYRRWPVPVVNSFRHEVGACAAGFMSQ